MANLSDFLPAAAASAGIGKTVTVGDYSYPNGRSLSDWDVYRVAGWSRYNHTYLTPVAPSTSTPGHYQGTITAANTYATIVDITSSTNGGGIFQIAAHKSVTSGTSDTINIKVTLDGTAKEYTFDNMPSYGVESHLCLIGKIPMKSDNSNQNFVGHDHFHENVGTFSYSNSGNYYYNYKQYDTTNEYFGITVAEAQLNYPVMYPVDMLVQKGYPYAHFTTSCKIELKSTSGANTTYLYANIKEF